jgi:dihydroorotate dehydrogenase electron transfer subunit
MLTNALKKQRTKYLTFLGGRTRDHLIRRYLDHLSTATDDGSEGFHGNVVELARTEIEKGIDRPKIFGCGPTPMLRVLADLASAMGVPCEISLEGPMGCGFGICQGCPVRLRSGVKEYALMCREGPVFSADMIAI